MPGPQRIEPDDSARGEYDLDRARSVFARTLSFLRRCAAGTPEKHDRRDARTLVEELRHLDPARRPEPAAQAEEEPPPSIQRRQSA